MRLVGIVSGFLSLVLWTSAHGPHPNARHIEIQNESGHNVGIYWQNPSTSRLHSVGDTISTDSFVIDSFVNHTLILREEDDDSNCESLTTETDAENQRCLATTLIVGEDQDQFLIIKEGMEIKQVQERNHLKPANNDNEEQFSLSECKTIAFGQLPSSTTEVLPSDMEKAMQSLNLCMDERVTRRLVDANEEVNLEARTRTNLADKLENYTCADSHLPTSTPIDTRKWTGNDGVERDVFIMHQRNASKIHVIHNFISSEECDAIESAAESLLHAATVADGKGGSHLSDSRKALQAGVRVPWEREAEGNGIATVSRRLYDYINESTGYGIMEAGQEDLMSIQYTGRGDDESAPDNYRPHCDGDCGGLEHKRGGRVATAVMYCGVPDKGGSTNFRNANVHVKPSLHTAVFFSYLDTNTNRMDTGFTEHSGCPVTEGKKSVAVQWLRLGVDRENPWDSFNTLTVSTKDIDG